MILYWVLEFIFKFHAAACMNSISSESLEPSSAFIVSERLNWAECNHAQLLCSDSLHLTDFMFSPGSANEVFKLFLGTKLTSLTIEGGNFNEHFCWVLACPGLSKLQTLKLINLKIDFSSISLSECFPCSLETLHLEGILTDGQKPSENARIPRELVNLRQVTWKNMKYSNKSLKMAFCTVDFCKLTHLDLTGNSVEDFFYDLHQNGRCLVNIESLILSCCKLYNVSNLFFLLQFYPHLKVLDLSHNLIMQLHFSGRSNPFGLNQKLSKVNFEGNHISCDQIYFLLQYLKPLPIQELRIQMNGKLGIGLLLEAICHWNLKKISVKVDWLYSDKNPSYFKSISNLSSLEEFTLNSSEMDATIYTLYEKLPLMSNLTTLNIYYPSVIYKSEKLKDLLKDFRQLQRVSLYYNEFQDFPVFSSNLLFLEIFILKCPQVENVSRWAVLGSLKELLLYVSHVNAEAIEFIFSILAVCSNLKIFKLQFQTVEKNINIPLLPIESHTLKKFTIMSCTNSEASIPVVNALLAKMPALLQAEISIDPEVLSRSNQRINFAFNQRLQSIKYFKNSMRPVKSLVENLDFFKCTNLQVIEMRSKGEIVLLDYASLPIPAVSFIYFLIEQIVPKRYPYVYEQIMSLKLDNLFFALSLYGRKYIEMGKGRDERLFYEIFPIIHNEFSINLLWDFCSIEHQKLRVFIEKFQTGTESRNFFDLYAAMNICLCLTGNYLSILECSFEEMKTIWCSTRLMTNANSTGEMMQLEEDSSALPGNGLKKIIQAHCRQFNANRQAIDCGFEIISKELAGRSLMEQIYFIQNFAIAFINPDSPLFKFRMEMRIAYDFLFGNNTDRLFAFLVDGQELLPIEFALLTEFTNETQNAASCLKDVPKNVIEVHYYQIRQIIVQDNATLASLFQPLRQLLSLSSNHALSLSACEEEEIRIELLSLNEKQRVSQYGPPDF